MTLHDYREQYPRTDKVPTLTQNGQLGVLLERRRRREARAAARAEHVHQMLDAFAHPLRTLHLDFGGKPAGRRAPSLRAASSAA
jgi:hypothetical protein